MVGMSMPVLRPTIFGADTAILSEAGEYFLEKKGKGRLKK
ncbi:hypothetical protein ES705_27220 [subsurface metagenome]